MLFIFYIFIICVVTNYLVECPRQLMDHTGIKASLFVNFVGNCGGSRDDLRREL